MGSPWKMFTQAQGQELIDGTNSTWTTINGVNGRKFTSKTDSSKYIFLPAGGWWHSTTFGDAGSAGYYWSNKYYRSSWAIRMRVNSINTSWSTPDSYGGDGYSIRAIQ